MRLYGLKTCDTCRKALKSLPDAEFVDVRVDGVSDSVLAQAFGAFGGALLNTRSTTWRGLDDAERARPVLDPAGGSPDPDEAPPDRAKRHAVSGLDRGHEGRPWRCLTG